MNKQDIAQEEAQAAPRMRVDIAKDIFPDMKEVSQFEFLKFIGNDAARHIIGVFDSDEAYGVKSIHFIAPRSSTERYVAVMFASRPFSIKLDRFLINEVFLDDKV